MITNNMAMVGAAVGAAALLLPRVKRRLELSRAKHRSLTGHSKMAKRFAALIPGYAYGPEEFFNADGAPAEILARWKLGFERVMTQGEFIVAFGSAFRRKA